MAERDSKEEEIETIFRSETLLHFMEVTHLEAAASLQRQLEEWKAKKFFRSDISPEKATLVTIDFMHDMSFISSVLEYLLSKERARLSVGLEPAVIQQVMEKL